MLGGVVALLLSVAPQGLVVEADNPSALCPAKGDVEEAVVARLGTVTGAAYTLKYGLIQNTAGGQTELLVRLLRDEALVLERTLVVTDGDCPQLSAVLAVIVESYFRDLKTDDTLPQDNPSPTIKGTLDVEQKGETTQVEVQPLSSDQPPNASKAPLSEAEKKYSPEYELILGAGARFDNLSPTLLLGARWEASKHLHLAGDASVQVAPSAQSSGGYQMELSRHDLRFGAGFHSVFGKLRVSGTPFLGLLWEAANLVDPSVDSRGAKTRVLGAVGAQLSSEVALAGPVSLGILARAQLLFGAQKFVVTQQDQTTRPLLALPRISSELGAYLGFHF